MRKLRVFVVELVLVGILVGWYVWKFPETLDPIIPWILWTIFAHLTWETILENERVKSYAGGIVERRKVSLMMWLIAFALGGLISVGYLWLAGRSLRKLTEFGKSHHMDQTDQNTAIESHGVTDSIPVVANHHEVQDAVTASSQRAPLQSPITKTRRFATLVPIFPGNPNVPIPMNQNLQDPHSEFYSDLSSLTGRPNVPPAGWPPYQERNLSDHGSEFAVRLIQFYVFQSIFYLIRGRSGVITTVGEGVRTFEREPITPPDMVSYPTEELLKVIGTNQFFTPIGAMIWKNPRYPLPVPKGTRLSLIEHAAQPDKGQMLVCTVRFERPNFYRLDFDVSSGIGANDGMPAGFSPQSIPGVTTWSVTITMEYKIQSRHDEGFQPELYSAWADALFDGLQKQIAF